MISASVGVNSSLLVEPAQTLTFALQPYDATSPDATTTTTPLLLTNISTRKSVVFKIRTTNADMFTVRPTQGVLAPGAELSVQLTLVPAARDELLAMPAGARASIIERFLIQSIDRAEDMRGFELEDLSTFWRRIPAELVTNKKLTCRFLETVETELTMSRRHRPSSVVLPPTEPAPAPTITTMPVPVTPPFNPRELASDNAALNPSPVAQPPPLTRPPLSPAGSRHDQNTPPPSLASSRVIDSNQAVRREVNGASGAVTPRSHRGGSFQSDGGGSRLPIQPLRSDENDADRMKQSLSHLSINEREDERLMTARSRPSDLSMRRSDLSEGPAEDNNALPADTLEYRVHPSDALTFPIKYTPTGQIDSSSYFFLTNKARRWGLAFKVKITNHKGYFVKPARGLIGPNSAHRIDVYLNEPNAGDFDAPRRELKDRFLIEVTFLDEKTFQRISEECDERRRREALQQLWADARERRQTMLNCQIIENLPVEPASSAQQARIRFQKSQAISSGQMSGRSSIGSIGEDDPTLGSSRVRVPSVGWVPAAAKLSQQFAPSEQPQDHHLRSPVLQVRTAPDAYNV